MKLTKTDVRGYAKDPFAKAVVSTDGNALSAYKKRRAASQNMNEELNTLKDDVAEIKALLKQLINKDTTQ